MSKHTPRPWFSYYSLAEATWSVQHSGGWIARVLDVEPIRPGEANARLIAAAPDLLEALEDLLEQLKKGRFVNEHGDAMGLFAMELVHAAIAKAEGKS